MQLVLASTSPRRRELLGLLGIPFEIASPTCEEQPDARLPPREQVARFAIEKAQSVARTRPQDLVLGSDTVIELGGRFLEKPVDLQEARAMLTRLAGRTHYVHTAVALCCQARAIESIVVETATVYMKAGITQAIERYLETGESLGKAGAYSIQGHGGDLIDRIEGDYTIIVGLPLRAVVRKLSAAGYPLPRNVDALYDQRPYPNWNRFVD